MNGYSWWLVSIFFEDTDYVAEVEVVAEYKYTAIENALNKHRKYGDEHRFTPAEKCLTGGIKREVLDNEIPII